MYAYMLAAGIRQVCMHVYVVAPPSLPQDLGSPGGGGTRDETAPADSPDCPKLCSGAGGGCFICSILSLSSSSSSSFYFYPKLCSSDEREVLPFNALGGARKTTYFISIRSCVAAPSERYKRVGDLDGRGERPAEGDRGKRHQWRFSQPIQPCSLSGSGCLCRRERPGGRPWPGSDHFLFVESERERGREHKRGCVCVCVCLCLFLCVYGTDLGAPSAHVCEVRERASTCVQCVRVCVQEIYSFLCRERARE